MKLFKINSYQLGNRGSEKIHMELKHKACPGGSSNPCNGNGKCQEGYPMCRCDPGFAGTACELCNDTRYGDDCSQECACVNGVCSNGRQGDGSCSCYSGYKGAKCDEKLLTCDDLQCMKKSSVHSRCIEVDGIAACDCDIGYRYNASLTDCVAINPCENPKSPCGLNSVCMMVSPGRHTCTCEQDFTGDGIVCMPINPCDVTVGICGENTRCSMIGPNKHICHCNIGWKYTPGVGCSLINVCSSKSCPKNAICETYEPYTFRCMCKEGFISRNKVCIGNIYQAVLDLNKDGEYAKSLDYSIQMIRNFYYEPLQNRGPFTIFLPTDKAFREVSRQFGGFEKFLQNVDRARQILRQHIIIGKSRAESLNRDKVYTLQGIVAEIKNTRNGMRYKLGSYAETAKILKKNIEASNGMIHIVNRFLTFNPKILGNTQKTAMELISQEEEYDKFEMLINALNMSEEFNKENITIFAPSNAAWNTLPNGGLQYLMEDENGQQKLRAILRNHIFPGYVDVVDLIQKSSLQSLQGVTLKVKITEQSQIVLNDNAGITQVDIPCKGNVYYYHIEGLLVPEYIKVVHNTCPIPTTIKVKGKCQSTCEGIGQCPMESDTPIPGELDSCIQYPLFGPSAQFPLPRKTGCTQVCNRTLTIPKCCEGFFGSLCLPCPGGFHKPCNGNGQCLDSISGNGRCLCSPGFMGTACEMCSQQKVFGPYCNQTCSCLHGECDDGPKGSGKCRKDSCQFGFLGENCERKLLQCGSEVMLCHSHSECYKDEQNNYRCQCSPGYEGNGLTCTEKNRCLVDNGGCHSQAKCTKLGPGSSRCDCNPGWTGDGYSCAPKIACSSNKDCHLKATCRDMELDKYHCICNMGYKGDGTHCELVNPCVENNGGCHPKALCTPVMFGVRNCSCPSSLDGDGFNCYGTIYDQVKAHPNLTYIARYLETNKFLVIYKDKTEKLTLFAPSDEALDNYLSKLDPSQLSFLDNDIHSFNMFRFHTLAEQYSSQQIKSLTTVYKTFATMYDGFSLRMVYDNQSLHIFANHSSFAVILEGDIPAVNGFIHIVDKVLEPFIPDNSPPALESALASQPDLQLFYQALKASDLMDMLQDWDEFTVFAPVNSAMKTMNTSNMSQHLKYYIVARNVFTPTLETGDTVESSLGSKHPLEFTVINGNVLVNNVKIIRSDILFDGGVLHIIEDLIHPVLHYCNNVSLIIANSSCASCDISDIAGLCPVGFVPVMPIFKMSCSLDQSVKGCQILCEKKETILQCCDGYYGASCDACPGGPETPCNGHGVCSDGSTGDGHCSCDIGYVGQNCGQCLQANMTPPFCTDSMGIANCSYMNGNCSQNAECTITKSDPSCRCRPGYIGDGYKCSSPCDTPLAGKCHQQAQCVFNDSVGAMSCVCNTGYYGNGTWCTRSCLINNGGCDRDRAKCTDSDITGGHVCTCNDGYVGNGTICNKDIIDAVTRIPVLSNFNNWLNNKVKSNNGKERLSKMQNVTLFAPVSKNWDRLELLDLVIIGQYIRLSSDKTKDSNVVNKDDSFKSESGKFINITVQENGQIFVNEIAVVESNIETTNGIIHLTAESISEYVDVRAETSRTKDKSKSIIIIVTVAAVVIVALVVIVAYVIHRKKYETILQIFKKSDGVGSESNLSFARLSAQEEDSDSFKDADASKYDNPVYTDADVI
ncbi:stabilin-2-like isoform X2 [Biomphalaria glabrata]|uniref:Stabilin-2-like isoform X2 n=1 Tax=Biomphalaria glabrata TaxID=6526 RepID=A0A9W3A4H6_BIOGL|nr:stabilin-2-like isoform X2 [Biomphalaria glabrata]